METVTDYAGNTYPVSWLNEQESPGFDSFGARKDQAWKTLGEIMNKEASKLPRKGDRVVVTKGRKHKGKEGIVFWRGRDSFGHRSRYGSDMQNAMVNAMGMNDRLGIQTEDGEKFFTALPNCEKKEGV